jgi:hypothetical protein
MHPLSSLTLPAALFFRMAGGSWLILNWTMIRSSPPHSRWRLHGPNTHLRPSVPTSSAPIDIAIRRALVAWRHSGSPFLPCSRFLNLDEVTTKSNQE